MRGFHINKTPLFCSGKAVHVHTDTTRLCRVVGAICLQYIHIVHVVMTTNSLILLKRSIYHTLLLSFGFIAPHPSLQVSAGDNKVLTLPLNTIGLYASAWPKETSGLYNVPSHTNIIYRTLYFYSCILPPPNLVFSHLANNLTVVFIRKSLFIPLAADFCSRR